MFLKHVSRPPSAKHAISKFSTRPFSSGQSMFTSSKYFVPLLMEMPHIVSPKLSHTLRNHFLARTLITPYFDNDFSVSEFDIGAHFAASSVSNSLAKGDISGIDHLVTPEALDVVSKNLRLVFQDKWHSIQMWILFLLQFVYTRRKKTADSG